MVCFLRRNRWCIRVPRFDWTRVSRAGRVRCVGYVFCRNCDKHCIASHRFAHTCLAPASFGSSRAQVESFVVGNLRCYAKLAALLWPDLHVRIGVGRANDLRLRSSSFFRLDVERSGTLCALNLGRPPNKVLQRARISDGCFPWRSARAAELGR